MQRVAEGTRSATLSTCNEHVWYARVGWGWGACVPHPSDRAARTSDGLDQLRLDTLEANQGAVGNNHSHGDVPNDLPSGGKDKVCVCVKGKTRTHTHTRTQSHDDCAQQPW
jgi:hypothetical protein